MKDAFEAERSKASRLYDGLAELSDAHKRQAARLLAMAATLECGYQAFRGSGNP